jgi:pSer/pThr/pTyr-binding forkhead associated (FHA) protein
MGQENPEQRWQINWLKPRIPWSRQAIRPAEVGDGLCSVMMARENLLEDANYNKIVPNHFIVELSPDNYLRNYQPLWKGLLEQWREKLVESLMTANSRQGRIEYRFGGQLQIELRSGQDLKDSQARILSRVQPDPDSPDRALQKEQPQRRETEVAYLEWIGGDRRWPLYPGDNTIGREKSNDIFLDFPQVQEKRLVSGQHAFIRCIGGQCTLIDGALSGKPSANGTYVNARQIPKHGISLQDGDRIILASLNPQEPWIDTPGVAAFLFKLS